MLPGALDVPSFIGLACTLQLVLLPIMQLVGTAQWERSKRLAV